LNMKVLHVEDDLAGIDRPGDLQAEEAGEEEVAERLAHAGANVACIRPRSKRWVTPARPAERDAPLAAVDRKEVGALATLEGRAVGPAFVAPARLLDLDHVGAEIAEQHGAERPGDDARQVEHAHSGQWPWRWVRP
jgi:hypothetical protein